MPEILTPAVVLLLAALVIAVVPRTLGAAVFAGAPLVAGLLFARIAPGTEVTRSFFGSELTLLRVDDLSVPFAWIFLAVTFLAALYGLQITSRGERIAALVGAAGGVGVVLAGDLVTMFVFWEMKAVASAALIWMRRSPDATSAGMRYMFVHLVGGTILLAGILLYFTQTGSLRFEVLGTGLAATLVLIGFVLAAAVPPLHAWLPDGYPRSTVTGTVFLSAFTTKAAVYALARGFPGMEVLVWAGVIMALYGVVYAVLENDIRRLLAYHIVSQVGFMVCAVGIGTPEAINGATAHAFAHVLYKGLLLMGAGAVLYSTTRSKLTDLGGLVGVMPLVFAFYMVAAFAISGVPGFSGFVTKELVVDAASLDGRTAVVLLLKLASVGTFLSTALKLPYFTWLGPQRGVQTTRLPWTMLAAMGVAAAANIVLGLVPSIVYDLMPYPVAYEPFSLYKIVETTQLLVFTAVAFVLLHSIAGAVRKVNIDTDWLYRRFPQLVAQRLTPPARAVQGSVPKRPVVVFPKVLEYRSARSAEPPWAPSWALGAAIVVVVVVLLGVALLR